MTSWTDRGHGLTTRLDAILNCLSPGRCLADIGCDHGKLAKAALASGRFEHVLATDVSMPSLQKARELLAKEAEEGLAEFRCGDGLSVLACGEADAIVIAGMGGEEMIRILEADQAGVSKEAVLVLSPHRNADKLRTFLAANGYEIAVETAVRDGGTLYPILRSTWDGAKREPIDPFAAYVGMYQIPFSGDERAMLEELRDTSRKITSFSGGGPEGEKRRALHAQWADEIDAMLQK